MKPYNLTFHPDTEFYTFTTDQELVYYCRFSNVMAMLPPLLGIYDIEVGDFVFYAYNPAPNVRKKLDLRIQLTITDLLERHFFIKPERVLVYTCDDTDRILGGRCRQKLFRRWFMKMNRPFEHYELEVDLEADTEIETTHGGVIIRKDFPHSEILQTHLIDQVEGIFVEKFGGSDS